LSASIRRNCKSISARKVVRLSGCGPAAGCAGLAFLWFCANAVELETARMLAIRQANDRLGTASLFSIAAKASLICPIQKGLLGD